MTAVDGEDAFEVGARYRTRAAIDALRDRFAAGEVLVYWRYGYSRYDDARGWFFRQPGSAAVRSYDLLGDAPLLRDELFERVSGPAAVVLATLTDDAVEIERLLADGTASGDPDEALDREIAAERALVLDRPGASSTLITRGALAEGARIALLQVAAQHGRARAIVELLASGITADAAAPHAQTALVSAVSGGHVAAVRALIAAGADPDRAQASGPPARAFARSPKIAAALDGR